MCRYSTCLKYDKSKPLFYFNLLLCFFVCRRDHPFDMPERRHTKGQRKCGTVSAPEHPTGGAMPIRQFHYQNETKILSHERAGVS